MEIPWVVTICADVGRRLCFAWEKNVKAALILLRDERGFVEVVNHHFSQRSVSHTYRDIRYEINNNNLHPNNNRRPTCKLSGRKQNGI